LPVHHIKPFREFDHPEEANKPENLIGLCQSCHMKREPRVRKANF
jgi:predicted HNH restriction endonuclease